MHNQYKVLQEKYALEVEAKASSREKAIYNTKPLTDNFLPKAQEIFKSQVLPQLPTWPDFDIMTDKTFPYYIFAPWTQEQFPSLPAIKSLVSWAELYIYDKDSPYAGSKLYEKDLNALLERWFVFRLYENVFTRDGKPKDHSKDVQYRRAPPRASNAEFIQGLINFAVQIMRLDYDRCYKKAIESGALKEYKAIRAAQTQHTATHGVDLSNL